MLKRAGNWVLVAVIAAFFGFTGILHWTAAIAQTVFFVCAAFGVLSLLLSLFEAPDAPPSSKLPIEVSLE